MQIYVWGILISTFILDVLKNNLGGGQKSKSISEEVAQHNYEKNYQDNYASSKFQDNDVIPESDIGGMKIKLNGEEELPIQYESTNSKNRKSSTYNNYSHSNKENVVLRIQYCTS
jgi:hypothetical protein